MLAGERHVQILGDDLLAIEVVRRIEYHRLLHRSVSNWVRRALACCISRRCVDLSPPHSNQYVTLPCRQYYTRWPGPA